MSVLGILASAKQIILSDLISVKFSNTKRILSKVMEMSSIALTIED
jgi:hypothetical protein